ncbi:MAG: CRISPR-associated protein Cas5 [Candidatus Delongbacteria bacterium]|jgi:CRISPR-associated protein Cas5t|nr:CRISPR-associated protein Cas5 [Candidatus Delongbacteria bacterium]
MKALRIVLTQSKAHYRKEESLTNKMTYPLPPFSTVIGALHKACKFKEYQPMDLSIQGSFTSLIKQPYTDYCFLDSVMDDRGILVKLKNSHFQSSAFDKVASAMKSQGNSFRKGVTIQVHDELLMEEYRNLKNLKNKIDECKKDGRYRNIKNVLSNRKKALTDGVKGLDKKSDEYKALIMREKQIKAKEKRIDEKFKEYEFHNYTKEMSKYKSLTTSLRFYEILHDVKLIIHIKSDDETLQKIENEIYCLKSIGRSEDFVDVKECKIVELFSQINSEKTCNNSAYIDSILLKNEDIYFGAKQKEGIPANGTKYWLNKVYEINKKGQRDFSKHKKKVLYASGFKIDSDSKNVYLDEDYIVNFN